MTGYDREWTTRRGLPSRSRLRFGLTKRGGEPVRFLVPLEHRRDGAWRPVARFDHDAFGPTYRNVELVGLHLDAYDPGGFQIEKRKSWTPHSAAAAMGVAEEYLRRQAERLVRRYEAWR